jgi:pimeloyl-ACP methyl ester carboxylesterase
MHAPSNPAESKPALAAGGAWRRRDVTLGGGVRLAVFETGPADGPPVVLLHGIGHWTQAAWDVLAPHLAGYRAIAIDLPGFGDSAKPDAPYDLPFFARVVAELADAMGLERFALAGNSLGGMIAAEVAGEHPKRVAALLLIAPAGFLRTPGLVVRIFGLAPLMQRLSLRPPRGLVRRVVQLAVSDPSVLSEAVLERAYELSGDPQISRAFGRVYWNHRSAVFDMRALHARFARYAGPVAILWGTRDNYLPIAGLQRARLVYPAASVTVLEGCGHLPQVERPTVVAAELRAIYPAGGGAAEGA